MAALGELRAEPPAAADQGGASHQTEQQRPASANASGGRRLRQPASAADLSGRYGECHVAANGREAVEAFRAASEDRTDMILVCMDIMMPEMDGREAVRRGCGNRRRAGIFSTSGARSS